MPTNPNTYLPALGVRSSVPTVSCQPTQTHVASPWGPFVRTNFFMPANPSTCMPALGVHPFILTFSGQPKTQHLYGCRLWKQCPTYDQRICISSADSARQRPGCSNTKSHEGIDHGVENTYAAGTWAARANRQQGEEMYDKMKTQVNVIQQAEHRNTKVSGFQQY